jgi:hypothetical protein
MLFRNPAQIMPERGEDTTTKAGSKRKWAGHQSDSSNDGNNTSVEKFVHLRLLFCGHGCADPVIATTALFM